MTTIWLDMDGTLADLYGVKDWLPKLRAYDPSPYRLAAPLVNMAALARILNNRRKLGYRVCIISALSKDSIPEFSISHLCLCGYHFAFWMASSNQNYF